MVEQPLKEVPHALLAALPEGMAAIQLTPQQLGFMGIDHSITGHSNKGDGSKGLIGGHRLQAITDPLQQIRSQWGAPPIQPLGVRGNRG